MELLSSAIRHGEDAPLPDSGLAAVFGAAPGAATVGALWRDLLERLGADISDDAGRALDQILTHGTLAARVLRAVGPEPDRARLVGAYRELEACMAENALFSGRSGTAPGAS